VERRNFDALDRFVRDARRTASSAALMFSTTDSRWAVVSTSVTALIAGSIAWLAAATMPPSSMHYGVRRSQALMPYELFMRLAAQNRDTGADYTSLGAANGHGRAATQQGSHATDQNSDNSAESEEQRTVTLDPGETLAGALTDAGATSADIAAALHAMASVYDLRSVRAGQSFDLTFAPADVSSPPPVTAKITYSPPSQAAATADEDSDEGTDADAPTPVGKLLSLHFSPTVETDITVTRNAGGAFTATSQQQHLQARYHRAGATIDSSVYLAAMRAGIPAKVVVQMLHMFSYKVDFQRDIRPGDSFQVLYSYYYAPGGQPVKEGNIVYATMNLGDRKVTLYRYKTLDGDVGYFDAEGVSAEGLLMRRPVNGGRISSGFGWRINPITHGPELHKGIDIAVPVGTPVMAAGSGTIQYEGPARGYGNFLMIKHTNVYSTAYGHLSRFAKGTHIGSHVDRGQIVAYTGDTGESTGPHLHYEIRIDGRQVNPLTVKVATEQRLYGRDLRDFLDQRIHVDLELASMPLESKVADSASADLRAAKD
jgi:murein DD-endopeptidase MepM/ murein hydrolase activator NlpD